MGQLIDRIFRYAKSVVNDTGVNRAEDYIDKTSEEAELKRIIDELNEKKKEDSNKKKQSGTSRNTHNDETMTFDKAFSVLGLKNNATNDEVKDSYRKKMKEYHPDRVSGLGEELQELAKKKTMEINQAYDFIRNIRKF